MNLLLLKIAGLGQLALVAGSLMLPGILNWRRELAGLSKLTRQIFWVYACYIFGINLAMSLLTLLRPQWLAEQTPLARALCAFMGLYWATRLGIQFFIFDRSLADAKKIYAIAEAALVVMFAFWAGLYGWLSFS